MISGNSNCRQAGILIVADHRARWHGTGETEIENFGPKSSTLTHRGRFGAPMSSNERVGNIVGARCGGAEKQIPLPASR